VLCSGLALFVGMDVAFNVTHNLNLLPAVILLGATLVPVTFVVYVHQRVQAKDVPVGAVAAIAFLGGALGLLVAGFVDTTGKPVGIYGGASSTRVGSGWPVRLYSITHMRPNPSMTSLMLLD